METLKLTVNGMSCEHCASAIKKGLGAITGIHSVSVDLELKTVTVECESSLVTPQKIISEIEELGYEVSP